MSRRIQPRKPSSTRSAGEATLRARAEASAGRCRRLSRPARRAPRCRSGSGRRRPTVAPFAMRELLDVAVDVASDVARHRHVRCRERTASAPRPRRCERWSHRRGPRRARRRDPGSSRTVAPAAVTSRPVRPRTVTLVARGVHRPAGHAVDAHGVARGPDVARHRARRPRRRCPRRRRCRGPCRGCRRCSPLTYRSSSIVSPAPTTTVAGAVGLPERECRRRTRGVRAAARRSATHSETRNDGIHGEPPSKRAYRERSYPNAAMPSRTARS